MKKQILLLCALLSVGQYCSAVTKAEVKKAQDFLNTMTSFFENHWNTSAQDSMNKNDIEDWKKSITTITNYAIENSTDIFGNVDMPLAEAAAAIIRINDNIRGSIALLQENSNVKTNRETIEECSKQLNEISPSISRYYKTISKQYAQKTLQDTIANLLLIIDAVLETVPEK